MIKLSKMNINKMIEEKYTILIVPNNTRNTKHFVFSKMRIAISLMLTIVMISTFFILYGLYFNEKRANIALIKSNKQDKYDLKLIQQDVQEKQKEVDAYKKSTENIKDKMDELNELENKINSILGNESIKLPPSRGGTGVNTSYSNIDADGTINKLNQSLSKLQTYEFEQRKVPSIFPCVGNLTSRFGSRNNPFGISSTETHSGIDISNSIGTPIKAAADGIVTYANWESGYGYVVKINHGNGYETFYGHNSKLKVTEGTQVKRGDIISLMGSTGRSTGPHCHFEVRLNNNPIDPLKLIK